MTDNGDLRQRLIEAGGIWSAADILADWEAKARAAKAYTARQEPWPAWSMGELLAAALIVHDRKMLTDLDYSPEEAIERLRHELSMSTAEATRAFADLAWSDA